MLGTKIGFDIGSSTIFALAEGREIAVSEPSVIAYDTFTGKVMAIGQDAADMLGRNPDSLTVIQPVRQGAVCDFDAVQQMLSFYIQKICGNRIFKPNVMMCVPAEISEIDRRSLLEIAENAGASRACVVEEPLAAALGAGFSPAEYKGRMVADIGGGTTELAIIAKGGIAVSKSVAIAGESFDDAICRFLRRERDIIIGTVTAEQVKQKIGAAKFLEAELAIRVTGKDYFTKLPKSTEITSTDIFLCVKEHLDAIAESIKEMLMDAPPELAADIYTNGIVLTGGSAMLRGIDEYLSKKTGYKVVCAENPAYCVINGISILLKDMNLMEENGYVFAAYNEINDYGE